MTFNPNEPLSTDNLTKTLTDHENLIANIISTNQNTNNINISDVKKTVNDLKIFSRRESFSISQTLNKIKFPVSFNSIPTVTLTVEQQDPFFVTAVIKSVTVTDIDYAIFYSGNINVQNYTLHIIAIGD